MALASLRTAPSNQTDSIGALGNVNAAMFGVKV
jgi:hypothetical protein